MSVQIKNLKSTQQNKNCDLIGLCGAILTACVILQCCKQDNVFNAFALMLVKVDIDPRKKTIVKFSTNLLKHSCLVLFILLLLIAPNEYLHFTFF